MAQWRMTDPTLSAFVLIEKTIPSRTNKWVGRIAGLLLIGWQARVKGT